MNAPSRESLRSRRRRETQREIQRAALRLAHEQGFGKVTVEMISAEAGVSPRTFFNYFPSKEAAVVHGPGDVDDELVEEFVAAGPASPKEVLADLARVLVRQLATDEPPAWRELHDIVALAREHLPVHAALLAQFEVFQRGVAGLAARRLGGGGEDEVPSLVAAVVIAALREGIHRWAQGSDDEASPMPYVERSVLLLHTLFAS
jgi:AcrR family transcriptional regulator